MKILITGPSGSGKSYLTKELRKFGLKTVDADTIQGLSSWYDGTGKPVIYPENAGKEFFDNHSFLWDKSFLIQYLSNCDNIYVMGLSGNVLDMLNLFDVAYYLDVSPQVMDERLQHPSRENPMGNTEFQRQNAISWASEFKQKALSKGLIIINAEQSAQEIYKFLTRNQVS